MVVIMGFLKANYMWIFSGIGVFVISLFFVNRGSTKINNKINGDGNIQAGGNIITYQTNRGKDEQAVK